MDDENPDSLLNYFLPVRTGSCTEYILEFARIILGLSNPCVQYSIFEIITSIVTTIRWLAHTTGEKSTLQKSCGGYFFIPPIGYGK